jgi:GGDEF domain-containing protein
VIPDEDEYQKWLRRRSEEEAAFRAYKAMRPTQPAAAAPAAPEPEPIDPTVSPFTPAVGARTPSRPENDELPETKPRGVLDFLAEGARAIVRGTGSTMRDIGSAAELIGQEAYSAPGAEPLGRLLQRGGKAIEESVAPARVAETSQIKSGRDVGDFVAGTAGSAAASSAPSLGGAAAGFAVGGPPGALVGAFLASYLQNAGNARREMGELGVDQETANETAAAIGIPMAALDAYLPSKLVGRFSKTLTADAVRHSAKAIAKNALVDVATEGITEGLQEGIQYAGTRYATPEDDFSVSELLSRGKEAAIQGAVGGATVSAGTEVASRVAKSLTGKSIERRAALDEMQRASAAAGAVPPAVEVPPGSHEPPPEVAPPEAPPELPEGAQGPITPQEKIQQLEQERRALEKEANTDPLTGLGNKRAQQGHLKRVEQDKEDVDVVAMDLEALGVRNNTEGEPAGDAMLQRASTAIAQAADELGIDPRNLYRHGGDEFSAVVPKGLGEQLVSRARELMGDHPIGESGFANRLGGAVASNWTDATARLAEYKRNRPKERQSKPMELPANDVPKSIVRMAPADIVSRPDQMQFKSNVDPETGTGQELKGVKTWNEDLAGVISVWKDPESGETVVVNGHHRLELAKRLGVDGVNVRYVFATTPEAARATGAFINIAEGRGTATDVAKFLRDTGATQEDLENRGVSIRGDLAKKGVSLSKLAPDLFAQVATGKLDEGHAAAIGEMITDPERQREAVQVVRGAKGRMTQAEVREVARQIEVAGSETVTQDSLFGEEESSTGLYVPRAQVAAALKSNLAKDRRLFGFITKGDRATALEGAGGTKIDKEAATQRAADSAAVEELFDRLYTRGGEVARLITEAARRVAQGESPKGVAREIQDAVTEALLAERTAAEGGAGRSDRGNPEAGRGGAAAEEAGEGGAAVRSEGAVDEESRDSTDPNQDALFSPDLFGGMDQVDRGGQGQMFGADEMGNRQERTQKREAEIARRQRQLEGDREAGKITAEEFARRRDELGNATNPDEAAAMADPLQSDFIRDVIEDAEGTLEELKRLRAESTGDELRQQVLERLEAEATREIEQAELELSEAEQLQQDAEEDTALDEGGYRQESLFNPANQATEAGRTWRKLTGAKRSREDTDVQSVRQIAKNLYDAMGIWGESGRGKFAQRKALGWYNLFFENIRLVRWDSGKLKTAAHEAGHYISKKFLGWPTRTTPSSLAGKIKLSKEAVQELNKMGTDLYGARKPGAGYGEEGIAEWVGFFVTDPDVLAEKAPEFSKVMDEVFKREPELYQALKVAQLELKRHKESSPARRFASMISEKAKRRGLPTANQLVHLFIDDNQAVREVMRLAVTRKGKALSPAQNISWLMQLTKGVADQAVDVIKRGWVAPEIGSIKRITRPLKSAFDLIPVERHRDFIRYLVAMRVLELHARGVDSGFDVKDALELTNEAAQQEFRAAGEIVWENKVAELVYRYGTKLTKDEIKKISRANKFYISFERVLEHEDGARGGSASVSSTGLKRIKGSDLQIRDPRETLMTDVFRTLMDVRIHRAVQTLAEFALFK